MPEGHAIGWIDAGHGVVPPATSVVGLVAAAIEHCSFPLSEVTWRISFQTSSIPNSREHVGARYRVTDGRVAVYVYSDTWHPAPQPVVIIGPGLLLHRCVRKITARNIKLIPTNTGWASAVRVVETVLSAHNDSVPPRFW